MTGLIYFLFFCSGASGLIYQVAWVRAFGNVFGNTVYSTSLIVAVFMLGLGLGSFAIGAWADRRYASGNESLLRAYGGIELLIASMGAAVSLLLPHLDRLSALVSSYSRDSAGWFSLSTMSYVARGAVAVGLLTPITLLMGGTLTLLIRHLVRRDLAIGGRRIAALYGVNTAGAALGCFLTDFALVPLWGLRAAQLTAAVLNLVAAVGALWLASRATALPGARAAAPRRAGARDEADPATADRRATVGLTSAAIALTGFAGMGLEILWLRHFTILLGAFRAVFSLLLTVVLIGIGAGSMAGGLLLRRTGRPARSWIWAQALLVVSTLAGLAMADARDIAAIVSADPGYLAALGNTAGLTAPSEPWRTLAELWFDTRPILIEAFVPALLMGVSFPLANAMVQRAERSVGRRAGVLYLSNTVGAVCGSLACGFVLLPGLGIQGTATVLVVVAGLAVAPLFVLARTDEGGEPASRAHTVSTATVLLVAVAALLLWVRLPAGYLLDRALWSPNNSDRTLAISEGINEVIAIRETPGQGRTLFTNGHAMSSTRPFGQRYMRALAHIPLLAIDRPERALVIGFGVGNTTDAATLHPSVQRVEVADLSRDVLAHAGYFADANHDALRKPSVVVYVNDGRHHLQMQPPASYDLIALEPPPIAAAGAAALYSREFYQLARGRLTTKGYISQWLPAYQVPPATTLQMVRAFVDVFPSAVLMSGYARELLLIGTVLPRVEVDPEQLQARLSSAPAVEADLRRLDLGSVREIVGTFIGSARTLADATRDSEPAVDDRPLQEYGIKSLLGFGEAVPPSLVDLSDVAAWCPACFAGGQPAAAADGLDTYLSLLNLAYAAPPQEAARARRLADEQGRRLLGSRYLGAVVPESAAAHTVIGLALVREERLDEGIAEFRVAARLEPDSPETRWRLGVALAQRGAHGEAVEQLARAVQLDPANGRARYDLAHILLQTGRFDEGVAHLREAVRLMPGSPEAHNDLGVALASRDRVAEAIGEFQRALDLNPGYAPARSNLTAVERRRR